MSIPKGRITSLWGISGSGKSTLVKIIQRKYPVKDGKIFIDAAPIEMFDLDSYREGIGVVPQEVKVFNGTILENILVGRQVEEVKQVLKRVDELGLSRFLSRFDHGIVTLIGEEGRQLSSGEKQLLALIRALLAKPEIVIVDEGISAIDVEVQHFVFHILRQYSKKHAVLIITHDLQTIAKTDYVYLLEDGITEESGRPDYLLRTNPRFRKLWEIQSGSSKELTLEVTDVL